MRLLHTRTLELHSFTSPEEVEEGYAILSHVWEDHEQTYQELQAIHTQCEASGEDPRGLVSPKIRRFCEVAAQQGYQWGWADTCCIDKTSSAELSEAINSMFQYYSLSQVCFVYLADVPTADALTERPSWFTITHADSRVKSSPFQTSKWHSRGWTLQELIAPRVVLFFTDAWHFLGSKADLADLLYETTSIPIDLLKMTKMLQDFSIAQRMSWAASRQTRRKEDIAYCLMGIFDVNMPPLYGEGQKAFQRLQEAILRQSPDTTLFAWGPHGELGVLEYYQTLAEKQTEVSKLFASSPEDFRFSKDTVYSSTPVRGMTTSPSTNTVSGLCYGL